MAIRQRKHKRIILVWLYFLCVGLAWTGNIASSGFIQTQASSIYGRGITMLSDTEEMVRTKPFINQDQEREYFLRYEEYRSYVLNVKKNFLDRIPVSGIILNFVNFIVSMLYVFCGYAVFKRSFIAKKFLGWGIAWMMLHFIILIGVVSAGFYFSYLKCFNLWLLFDPAANAIEFFELLNLIPLIILGMVIILVYTFFYIILPRYFLSHSMIEDQLV